MGCLPLTLFGTGEATIDSGWRSDRTNLDECCWVDHAPGFLLGADELLTNLESRIEWHRGKRLMYGTWHDEPRLTGTAPAEGKTVPAIIGQIRHSLSAHYDRLFTGLFCNYYETGQDSVAWHADRIGRTDVDPLVAIISLGGPRTFLLRPQGGGKSHRLRLGSGDLLVMGGATQHHWEHAVPKARSAPPRMSITTRAGGPRLLVRELAKDRFRLEPATLVSG